MSVGDTTDRGVAPVDETDTIPVPRVVLETLYDLAVGSLDFGSGFWDEEDQVTVGRVAGLLGLDPDRAEVETVVERRGVSLAAAFNHVCMDQNRTRSGRR